MMRINRFIWPAIAVGMVICGSSHWVSADESDVRALLDGVKALESSGLPGPIAPFGDEAFGVVVGSDRGGQLPVVAATRYGKGRVVAFGHGGFLGQDTMAKFDTGRMVVNAARWAAGDVAEPTVGVFRREGLVTALKERGLNAELVGLDELAGVDVLFLAPDSARLGDVPALRAFVEGGKGLVTDALVWGWQQLNPGKSPSVDMATNQLLAPMGLVYVDGMLGRTGEGAYIAGEIPSPLTNASKALDAALAHSAGTQTLGKDDLRLVSTVLARAAQVLPSDEAVLLPRIKALLADEKINVIPSPKAPITTNDVLARLVLTMQIRDANQLPADQVAAHPAAASFPGVVPDDAPRVTRELSIDTSVPAWHSTGLYAAPGELVTVELPAEAVKTGFKARIGSTHCRNWNHTSWARAPQVTREYPLKQVSTQTANAFGGLIYIIVPGDCKLGTIPVTVSNAVAAPYFELGKTSLAEWKNTIRNLPGPRAELASSKAILTVPAADVRELDNPAAVMRTWDRILDHCADLAARKTHDRTRPERYVADVQLCAGYMHAGYPIMIPTSAAPDTLSVEHLVNEGDWGLYHETGHNHQSGDWTFGGTGEVTVNLFTMYVYDQLCGIRPSDGRMASDGTRASVWKYISRGAKFDAWKRDPFLALAMYTQMINAFGWDAFKQVFAEYRDLPADERPKNDDEKRDQWMVRFSRNVGKNLGPFFQTWGVPTSEAARASIQDLPEWMPAGFPPRDPREDRIASKATVVSVSSENTPDGTGDNAVDGSQDTIWHSRWSGDAVPAYPHEITIDLGEALSIKGLTVLPRRRGANGWIAQYEVYVGADGKNWGDAVATGTFEQNKALKEVQFGKSVECRFVRLVAVKGFDDQKWASVAEIDVIPAE